VGFRIVQSYKPTLDPDYNVVQSDKINRDYIIIRCNFLINYIIIIGEGSYISTLTVYKTLTWFGLVRLLRFFCEIIQLFVSDIKIKLKKIKKTFFSTMFKI